MTLSRKLMLWTGAAMLAVLPGRTVYTASTDAGAGNWRMIVLTGPTQFTLAPPSQTGSLEYQAELNAIKSAQSRLTREQTEQIEYWKSGGVVRWNEILLGLVARYNLPPAPVADGTYPVPDANNPFADPMFPFANPPYAARAYSYVAVAQYEALKVAWYYKFLYNRPSPARVDSGVQALIPAADLPAYPSEDAVISGVTAEMLKLLFPASVEEVTLRAGQHRQAALLSGKATASDIAAGLALGQAVAPVIVARAAADGMRTAAGSPALFQGFAASAVARGEIPWVSQETPRRPPMLAGFGSVRGWMMTPDDFVRERPAPPPPTSSALMERELAEVRQAVDSGNRRELQIANFWADGPSTPTPPGHWNLIAAPHIRRAAWCRAGITHGAYRPRDRVAEHGDARRRRGLLGDEVLLLQSAPVAARPRAQDHDRPAELPVLHLGAFDVLGRRRGRAVLSLPFRRRGVRRPEGGVVDVAALRRDPLPLRHRDGQVARQAHRRLYHQLRAHGWGWHSLNAASELLRRVAAPAGLELRGPIQAHHQCSALSSCPSPYR